MAQGDAPRRRRAGRDLAIVAVLAAVVVVAYPRIEPLLPQEFRTAMRGALASVPSSAEPSAPAPSDAPQRTATVRTDVNLRSGASTNAQVITTLRRGLNVTVIDEQGGWMLVRVEDDARNLQRQGWVFGSFIQEAPALRSSALSVRSN
jgi:uncharacterized protein YgiM (DUF1202 family)